MRIKTVIRFLMPFVITNLLYVPLVIATDIKNVHDLNAINDVQDVVVKKPSITKIINAAALPKTVQHKTYVGVIPYYQVNNKTYILLGRETKDSRKVDAGVYADFGARVKINEGTILQKAATVLSQDTMGRLKISERDMIKSGKIIYKQIKPEHDVYYIFYKVSQQQFLKIKKFNVQHARLKASSFANANLEKDQFVWFSFEDLVSHTPPEPEVKNQFNVYTIDGKQMTANLRKYFVMDCLQNPELPDFMKSM